MTTLTQDIKDKLKRLDVFEKIIGVNVIVFCVGFVLNKLYRTDSSLHWLELPKSFGDFIYKPWSIITYGFTHYDTLHLVLNLFVLYFVSRMLLNLLATKTLINIYFLGILSGGALYLLVYNILPYTYLKNAGPLVGASAGIRALLIFLCVYLPYKEAQLLTFRIKLWYIGVALVVIDFIGLFSVNQGGNIAHFGGIFLGYFYAIRLQNGNDIGKGFEAFINWLGSIFSPKSNLKTVYKTKKKPFVGHNKTEFNEFNKQKKIDLILDKISKSGYDSLTKEEKEFLFKSGKD